jgi:hypothetical protein
LAIPAALWLAAATFVMVASMSDSAGVPASSMTLSEAAALRDRAELVLLIAGGADLEARSRVRGGIIREQEYMLTPLEAATVMRRDDVLRLLVAEGAALNDETFPVLYCLASVSGFDETATVLRELAPDRGTPSCDGVRSPL